MRSPDPIEPVDPAVALAQTWAADLVTVTADTEMASRRQTLRPPEDTRDETDLPVLRFEGPDAEFTQRGVLGEGGMAVVHAAWQRAMNREVAVKRTRGASGQRAAMVKEARVVGALEHPSVVPVYAVGKDEDGETVIVMQRVSGESWLALLRDPDHPLWGPTERLRRNLEVLISVCHAVELAHSRGWLHRDLKTENVMLGEFGEVYVLDWGIAVPLDVARSADAVFAGTPVYMAPEMAASGVLTERTDVFLLGAILFETLTGRPPHEGATLHAILYSAMVEHTWALPEGTPDELAAIVRRAMAYHPEDRFGSVGELREALDAFLVHRDAVELSERATATLESARPDGAANRRARLDEALFGLRQSLGLWPHNQRALQALQDCLTRLAELELAEDNPVAAQTWAQQLEPRDPSLEQRIEAKRAALETAAEELQNLRGYAAERDLGTWAAERRRRAYLFSLLILLIGGAASVAVHLGWMGLGYPEVLALNGVVAGIAFWGAFSRFGSQNLVSRSISGVTAAASLTPFLVLFATWRLGLPAVASFALDGLMKVGGSVVLGFTVQPAFLKGGSASFVMAILLLCVPDAYALPIATLGTAAAVALVGSTLNPPTEAADGVTTDSASASDRGSAD